MAVLTWREAVKLHEGFYQSLIKHPMPVREAAIRQIGGRSMALDVYTWLAYRLHERHRYLPALVEFAKNSGGHDNITLAMARNS